jgi:transcription termination/antitermination protein NusG
MKKELVEHAMDLARQEWGADALKPIGPQLQELVEHDRKACIVEGEWYVVIVEPGQHKLARKEIAARGLIPYAPTVTVMERHGRGSTRTVDRPMFGPYMFANCPPLVDCWTLLVGARGVKRLLGNDGKPLPVDPYRMEIVRAVEATKRDEVAARSHGGIIWHFNPGDQVRIKNGPFAAFYAELESAVDTNGRIKALVSIFGRQSRTELSIFDIEAL